MLLCMYQVIEKSLVAYGEMSRVKWVIDWPGQAVLCVSQKYWTAHVHEAIRNGQKVGHLSTSHTMYEGHKLFNAYTTMYIHLCRHWRITFK